MLVFVHREYVHRQANYDRDAVDVGHVDYDYVDYERFRQVEKQLARQKKFPTHRRSKPGGGFFI